MKEIVSVPDFDVCVIGGGIHGVGVAQAAAAAGHSVLLLEKSALAAGTSRASSKLIHGGLRYLETFEFGLVRESLRERRRLLHNAPHLVRRVPFHIPVYGSSAGHAATRRSAWQIRAGLSLYALLGGIFENSFRRLPRARWEQLDGLRADGLRCVFRYWDAQTDDAMLTAAVMRSAESLGAQWIAPAELLDAEISDEGVRIHYEIGNDGVDLARGEERSATARVLVNAAGPWIQEVNSRITPTPPPVDVELVQGAHIVVDAPLQAGVYYAEAPRDGRAVFFMPWYGQTLIGTTETPYTGDPDRVTTTDGEVDYLLETLRATFPGHPTDVSATMAGLRVLPRGDGNLNRRSRETHLGTDCPQRPRVLTIAGGKLTGYRATAEAVLARLQATLPSATAIADTRTLRLPVVERNDSVTCNTPPL